MESKYLRERCPVCQFGALEITNYTACMDGTGYFTAKCTNCGVVFDKLDKKAWHEDKTWNVETTDDTRKFLLINQDLDKTYDLTNFHEVVLLSMDLNEITGALKELISKKYSLDVVNAQIWDEILNNTSIFWYKEDETETI